jgi:hypothetical protein
MRRLTVNAGIRWEALNAQVLAGDSPAGRFVPARHFDAIENLPDWRDWAPRFSAVYDLFGNAKTALKFSLNRYNQQRTTGIADSYNALVSATSTSLAWTDKNKDDIAQGVRGCAYGGLRDQLHPAHVQFRHGRAESLRNYPRTWNLESALELQPLPGSGVGLVVPRHLPHRRRPTTRNGRSPTTRRSRSSTR